MIAEFVPHLISERNFNAIFIEEIFIALKADGEPKEHIKFVLMEKFFFFFFGGKDIRSFVRNVSSLLHSNIRTLYAACVINFYLYQNFIVALRDIRTLVSSTCKLQLYKNKTFH